jgi:hypothetical protein
MANMNINSKISLALDACLQVRHLEMIIYPVDTEIWEPRIFSLVLST